MAFCAYCGAPVDAVSYKPCVSCGSPTNGAPRPAVKGGTNTAAIIAVVAVIGVFLIAIIGIVAAVAIPNLLTAMQRSKQHRTIAEMRTIGATLEAYAENNNKRYPEAIHIDQLAHQLSNTYVRGPLPTKDGWGNVFRYDCWNSAGSGPCDSYVIASAGKDAKFENDDPRKYTGRGGTTNYDDDIVMVNGNFIQYPAGYSSGGAR